MTAQAQLLEARPEVEAIVLEVKRLKRENQFLQEQYIISRSRLDEVEDRTGWEKFTDSLLTLDESRIPDAISKLVNQQHLYYERRLKEQDDLLNMGRQAQASQEYIRKISGPLTTKPLPMTPLPIPTVQPEIKSKARPLKKSSSLTNLASKVSNVFKKKRKNKTDGTIENGKRALSPVSERDSVKIATARGADANANQQRDQPLQFHIPSHQDSIRTVGHEAGIDAEDTDDEGSLRPEDYMMPLPGTPPSLAIPEVENSRPQSRRFRNRPDSPSPRFVSHRSTSPSPGGNATMSADPRPKWLCDYGKRDAK